MGLTEVEKKALKGGGAALVTTSGNKTEPLAVRLSEAQRISGLSRSDLYRRAARKEIIFRKSGKTVIVDFPSLKALVQGLPVAEIRVAV